MLCFFMTIVIFVLKAAKNVCVIVFISIKVNVDMLVLSNKDYYSCFWDVFYYRNLL